jgi:Na+/proline symporter
MVYFVSIFVYLMILAIIGIVKSRQVKTQADFSVAGRTLSPWVMVCTMLAVWIGTGSIVGNAGKTYEVGMAAFFLPIGTFVGMILLSFIAARARNIEAFSVPEIIGRRFGNTTRLLAVIALVIAYMVIVSYQFNAGGMVLEVITGKKEKAVVSLDDVFTKNQVRKGYFHYQPSKDWTGTTEILFNVKDKDSGTWSEMPETFTVKVVKSTEIISEKAKTSQLKNTNTIKENTFTRVIIEGYDSGFKKYDEIYRLAAIPREGNIYLHEPKLTAEKATIIAAVFIIAYTMLAGLMSLAFADVVTGTIITVTTLIAFPVLLIKAGGFSGMEAAFTAMGDRPDHMTLMGVFSAADYINFLLPVFLLVMGDANQYQRIFASKNARGARTAVIVMIFLALLVEELIIAEAWFAGSMTPDPENGRYILIYAAKHFMPMALGIVFMITVVGIIVSTADSFLLVPSTTFIKDIYLNYINPKAPEKRIVFVSRLMVLTFGIIAWLVSRVFSESTTVFEKALYAFTVYGSAITPCLVAALFWKRATKQGAISSILAGTITTLLWEEIIKGHLPQEVGKLDAVLPAICLSVICLIVVSLLTKNGKTAEKGS